MVSRITIYYNIIKDIKTQSAIQMLANNGKLPSQQRKSEPVSQDDSIIIEPQRKQMTMHTDFDVKYDEDDRKIVLYIELDPKHIINLTKEANKGITYDDERKHYKNCIFIRKIQTPESKLKGNFRITYLHYKGLTFSVKLQPSTQTDQMSESAPEMFSKLKIHFKTTQKWETKWISSSQGNEKEKQYNFQVASSDVDKILKQKLLLEIFFEKNQKFSKEFQGIQNEGNTCYANSTLQVLYHFMPLRKMIVDLPSKKLKKLTKSLQQIFVDLMTSENSVRAESLLNCFEKLQNQHRQQDIHEFLISFFDELQNQLPEVASFWTGKDYEITYSKQVEYQSKQQQNFTQLQLFMSDTKGNHFSQIFESLKQLLHQDIADEPIDTDKFGKLTVYKSRFFQTMPPLLFMNIKRYEYNAKRRELKKINLDLTYPNQINLDFLMKTKQGLDYILYAVIVHKGRTPNSGHYFCFVNVSKQADKPNWYEFNDSSVRKANEYKVLNNYTGKKKQQIYLNEQYGKWAERVEPSEETAYLLAYIHKDNFEQYQNLEVKVPTWQLERLQEKLTLEQSKTMTAVKLFVLSDQSQFRPFQKSYELDELKEVKLLKDQLLEPEIKKLQKMLSCKVGTIWKVNCKTRTIKHICKNYGQESRITVNRHTEPKRGIRQPDYFMIVPQQKMSKIDDYQHKKLGILHIEHRTETENKDTVQIMDKEQILGKLQDLKKGSFNIQYSEEDLEYFAFGWNSYLHVVKS